MGTSPSASRPGSSQDAAIELLLAEPERLEPGLVGLDAHLKLDEHVAIDVLLRDSLGYPVVVLFIGDDVARELGRMAAVAEALQRGRYLLSRLYHNKGIDPSLRPRFVLMGPRFPDSAPRLLDMLAQVEVHAVEYRVVKSSVGRAVLDLSTFHRTSGGALAGAEWGASSAQRAPRTARDERTTLGAAPRPASRAAPPDAPRAGDAARARDAAAPSATGAPPSAATGAPASAASSAPASDTSSRDAVRDAKRDPGTAPRSADLAASPGNASGPSAPAPAAGTPGAAGAAAASSSSAVPAGGTDDDLELVDDGLAGSDEARSLYLRARDSIRSLSGQVTESRENGRVVFKVDEHKLAALMLDHEGFRIQVGDGAPDALVHDEQTFNDRLNSIFTLYFDAIES